MRHGREGIEAHSVDGRERLIAEDPVEGEEHGNLDEDRQDARKGVHARRLVESEGLKRLLFLIALVLLLQFLDLRLERLHRALGARRREGKGQQHEPDGYREQDDGDADIAARHERYERYERVIDGVIEGGVEEERYHGRVILR